MSGYYTKNKNDFTRKVYGTIRDRLGEGIAYCEVELYIKKLREEVFVAQAHTNKSGSYVIEYDLSDSFTNKYNPKYILCNCKTTADDSPNIFIKVYDKSCNEIMRSEIIYNAKKEEQIDLMEGGGDYKGKPEFDNLMQKIKCVIKNIDITELNYNDVIYIHQTLEIEQKEVIEYIFSYHLSKHVSEIAEIEPEVFYAFIVQNQPSEELGMLDTLSDNFDNMEDIKEEITNAIVNLPPEEKKSIILNAAEINSISLVFEDNIDSILQEFYKIQIQKSNETPIRAVLDESILNEEHKEIVMENYVQYNDMEIALEKSKENLTTEQFNDVKQTIQLGLYTGNFPPMVKALKEIINDPDQPVLSLVDFAKEDQVYFEQIIKDKGRPPEFTTDSEYAQYIENISIETYKTTAFLARLKNMPYIDEVKYVVDLWKPENVPEIDLISTNIDILIKENFKDKSNMYSSGRDNKKNFDRQIIDIEVIRNNIKKIQTTLRIAEGIGLIPTVKIATILLDNNIDSSKKIVLKGKDRSIEELTEMLKDSGEIDEEVRRAVADKVFSSAVKLEYKKLAMWAYYNRPFNQFFPRPIFPIPPLEDVEGVEDIEDFPTYKMLFGSTDYCLCEHCNSVYSSAAYLVDILHFISNRMMKDGTSAKDLLDERRPDIENIYLNCKNNTPMPYIDLVCEVLENAIAPSEPNDSPNEKGYQTEGTKEELKAHPENINANAYKELIKAKYPISMPFDLWAEESRIYLEHLGIKRYELMELFGTKIFIGTDKPSTENICAEYLGINNMNEFEIICNSDSAQSKYWGVSYPEGHMKKVSNFLAKTGITYEGLKDLLACKFINPDPESASKIENEDICKLEKLNISNIDTNKLDRINRFLRLWRKTGWKMWELDMVISNPNLGDKVIDSNLLVKIKVFKEIQDKLKLTVEQLLSFYDLINAENHIHNITIEKSLYEQLFLNTTVTESKNKAFEIENISDPNNNEKLLDHKNTILAALQLNENELHLLLSEIADEENVKLTLQNISIVHRFMLLSSALKLSIKDLLQVRDVADAQNLFESPDATYEFIEKYESIKSSKFDIEQIDYLLNYKKDSPIGISEETIKQYIENLRNELAKNKLENFENIIIDQISKAFQIETKHTNHLLKTLKLDYDENLMKNIQREEDRLLEKDEEGEYKNDINVNNFPIIYNVLYLLDKISIFIRILKIIPEELEYLTSYRTNHDLIDKLPVDFEKLPIDINQNKISFSAWKNLINLYIIKKLYPKPDGISIFEIFKNVIEKSITYEDLWDNMEKLTSWNLDTVKALDENRGIANPTEKVDLENYSLDIILHYHKCIQMMKRVGVKEETMFHWAKYYNYDLEDNNNFEIKVKESIEITSSIKQVVKAKYSNEQWLTISAGLQDQIREKKRAALVNYLVSNPLTENDKLLWDDVNSLYNYFLIDIEMSSCQFTTRILQATSTVQLFVQRCLMNFEKPRKYDEDWKQWRWMENYRVWEANRKIFLYPENWIEPELRDDKSPFFIELENELMQNEITDEYVESAFLNYLEKLDTVARLQVCGLYHEQDEETDVVHVIAKTPEQPSIHYYRKHITIDDIGHWTPWEKMDVAIDSEQVVPVIYNRQLHVFWPILTEKPKPKQNIPAAEEGTSVNPPEKYWEIQLAWSVYKNGKWTPRKVSKQKLVYQKEWRLGIYSTPIKLTNAAFNLRIIIPENDDLKINLFINRYPFDEYDEFAGYHSDFYATFYFNEKVTRIGVLDKYVDLIKKIENETKLITIKELKSIPLPLVSHFEYNYLVPNGNKSWNIGVLEKTLIPYSLIVSTEDYQIMEKKFFYQDNYRIYYIERNRIYPIKPHLSMGYLYKYVYNFHPFYHPYTELFIRELNKSGIEGILNTEVQLNPEMFKPVNTFDFKGYKPNDNVIIKYGNNYDDPNKELVDFSYKGSYSLYNWEIFFHIPFLIACKLSNNQRFEEAMKWFHYIFDPTIVSDEEPKSKYWKTKPFYKTNNEEYIDQEIRKLMNLIAEGDHDLDEEVSAWRDNPFKPHLVARMRTVAYQKAVVMRYIDNILAWADQLFRRDTFESVNKATLLYILAAEILGPRPIQLSTQEREKSQTYKDIEKDLDEFGNIIENAVYISKNKYTGNYKRKTQTRDNPILNQINILYFCIQPNDKLLAYWDKVTDRLYKIRYCMNIEGVARKLSLFEPPIEPGMLVKAVAGGIDISSALNDFDVTTPYYRFNILSQKATELSSELKSLGGALLSALEKKDAEELALLRSSHEISILNKVKAIKQQQIIETEYNLQSLKKSYDTVNARYEYYKNIEKIIENEQLQKNKLKEAYQYQEGAQILNIAASIVQQIPDLTFGTAGFGGTPTVNAQYGGTQISRIYQLGASILNAMSAKGNYDANMASIEASHDRRWDEWKLQEQLADKELKQIEEQIKAAEERIKIAKLELDSHEKQIENAQAIDEFMHNKYTNKELYDWMVGQISSIYFQCYQLAYDVAKKAEKCYQFELGVEDSSFIQFGYWDSLKKGLLAGERLYHDIKRMEVSYMEKNKRELELTKNISLALFDPIALLHLKEKGECFVELPEMLFDLDYPGHYFRRIKSLSITIPCVAGPYTTISCTVTLSDNKYRRVDNLDDDWLVQNPVKGPQSIATSHAQNDSGTFELNFRDERYLPFEGAGAISTWRIQLNKDFEQFDFDTISDVILHLKYTSKDGGEGFKNKVIAQIDENLNKIALAENREGLFRAFNVKNSFPNEWYKFLHLVNESEEQELNLNITKDLFPIFTKNFHIIIKNIQFFAKMKEIEDDEDDKIYSIELKTSTGPITKELKKYENTDLLSSEEMQWQADIGALSLKLKKGTDIVSEDDIEDLIIILNYEVTTP